MRVIAYVPETESTEKVTSLIDSELPEENFTVEYATTPDDLNQLVSVADHDAVLVFADDETSKPYAPIQNIDKRNLQGPIVTLYKDTSPKALLNALSNGSMVALEFNAVASSRGALPMLLNNASLGFNGQSQVTKIGALEIDFDNKLVSVNDVKVHFTGRQYDLLSYLIKHSDTLCSKERIFNALYLHDDDAELKIIDVFICKIRDTLNQAQPGLGDNLETVRGRGYQFTSNLTNIDKRHVKQFGSLEIDLAENEVRIEGDTVDLTVSEYMVLKTFAVTFPDSVSRAELVKQLSKFGREGSSDTVDRALYSMGRKLIAHGQEFEKFVIPTNDASDFILNVSKLDEKASKKIEQDVISLGSIKLNKTLGNASVRKAVFDVTEHEANILAAVMDAFPARITGQELVEAVYGSDGKIFNLNNHMTKLRAKLTEANNGEEVLTSRRGLGYSLHVQSERVWAKYADQLDITKLGPWTLDSTRHIVSYSLDDGETNKSVELNKSQFSVFEAIVTSYPKAITKGDLLTAVYGDDVKDKESALASLYAQMKGALKSELGDYAGGFRKITNGSESFRFDLDIDDVPQEILDGCKIKEVGPWAINSTLNMFLFDGDPIVLNDSEYAVTQTLIDIYPKPITKVKLAKKHFDGKEPSLNTCLTVLRKKIVEQYGVTDPFVNYKRGVGYSLVANRDELDDEQINSMQAIQIGDVSINMDLGQLSFGDETIELNGAELFALNVLSKANKPVTAKILSDFSKAAEHDREATTMYQAVRSLEDKMTDAGFDGQLIDTRRHAGFFLASKRDEVIANSEIKTFDGLSVNQTLMEITVDDISVALTPSEFKVIDTLASGEARPFKITELKALSDEDGEPFTEGTLNASKNKIRHKLIDAGVPEDKANVIQVAHTGIYLSQRQDEILASSDVKDIGGLSINSTLMAVTLGNVTIGLTPSEFKVVETLAENPTIPLSLDDLSKLSDEDGEPFAESTLNASKNNIKRKLIEAGVDKDDASIISNKVRVGYYLTPMADKLDRSRLNGKRKSAVTDKAIVSAGALSIHTIKDHVEYDGTPLDAVKGKPLDALVLMAQRHGDFITNEELAEHFFGKPKTKAEKTRHQNNLEMGMSQLRSMIDKSIPQLAQSIIMKVGDKGYGLTLDVHERESLLEKAGLQKTKKVKFTSPHAKPKGAGNAVAGMNGANEASKGKHEPKRESMADQLARLSNFKVG